MSLQQAYCSFLASISSHSCQSAEGRRWLQLLCGSHRLSFLPTCSNVGESASVAPPPIGPCRLLSLVHQESVDTPMRLLLHLEVIGNYLAHMFMLLILVYHWNCPGNYYLRSLCLARCLRPKFKRICFPADLVSFMQNPANSLSQGFTLHIVLMGSYQLWRIALLVIPAITSRQKTLLQVLNAS